LIFAGNNLEFLIFCSKQEHIKQYDNEPATHTITLEEFVGAGSIL
jgi:hypothetical protein